MGDDKEPTSEQLGAKAPSTGHAEAQSIRGEPGEAAGIAAEFAKALETVSARPAEPSGVLPSPAATIQPVREGLIFEFLIQAPTHVDERMAVAAPELNPRCQPLTTESAAALRAVLAMLRPAAERFEKLREDTIVANTKAAVAAGSLRRLDAVALSPADEARIGEVAQRMQRQWNRRHDGPGRQPIDFTARARERLVEQATGLQVGHVDAAGRKYLVSDSAFRPVQIRALSDYVAENYFRCLLSWSLQSGLISDQGAVAALAALRARLDS
ncbi:MAG: hypothetical protein IPK26_14770 [Planctomycetes bacterium]|nr:hypothetical protein [Planctomycetota bacterium]